MASGHRGPGPGVVGVFPEVIHFAAGVGDEVGGVEEAEVVLEDGDDEVLEAGVAGVGGVFEAVLAVAVGVVEEAAFRGVAEAVGGGHGLEVDDGDVLAHGAAGLHVAGDGDVHGFVLAVLADVGGDEAAFGGEGDALEVVGEGLANDVCNGTVRCGGAADAVVLGDHGLSR